jgi:hypothetical protein
MRNSLSYGPTNENSCNNDDKHSVTYKERNDKSDMQDD